MLEWKVVSPGDVLQAKEREDTAVLLENGNVNVEGKEMTIHQWLKSVYNWSCVETYGFSIHTFKLKIQQTLQTIIDEEIAHHLTHLH